MNQLHLAHESTGYFIPAKGGFVELEDAPVNASFNDITHHLGYHTDQIHTFFGDYDPESEIQAVGLEIFSNNVAYVCTQKSVLELPLFKVQKFLQKLRLEEEFDDVTVSGILTDGIKNGSLAVDFLARVLHLHDTEPNGVFYESRYGLYLYFNNGILTDFQPADGLNEWAKHFKQLNPDLMNRYEQVARKYWGNDLVKITTEVNIQASALSETPDALKNPYAALHEAEFGTVNYKMLMVYHYDQDITLDEFKFINHGRYKHLPSQFETGLEKYALGKFLYEFSASGLLLNKYQVS